MSEKEKTDFALRIFEGMSIVQNAEIIHPEDAQNFLQKNRIAALLQMMLSWLNSDEIDDLRKTTDLYIDDLAKYQVHYLLSQKDYSDLEGYKFALLGTADDWHVYQITYPPAATPSCN